MQANFLNSVIENIPDMIFVKDATHFRFTRLNKAVEELLGMSRDEMLNKTDFDLFPQDQAEFYRKADEIVIKNKCLLDIPEEMIDTKTHGRRYLHTKKIPIMDEQGRPQYLLGISEDIQKKKKRRKSTSTH